MNWLLLRGLLRDARHWQGLGRLFERTMPGSAAHCLDLPGIGTQAHATSPASVGGIMEDVRARWLDLRRGPSAPWGILGISLGGMVALEWAARHPEDFARLVVINTSAGDLSGPFERFRPANLLRAPVVLFTGDPVRRERALLAATTALAADPRRLEEAARRQCAGGLGAGKTRETGLRQLIAGLRFRMPRALAARRPPALTLIGLKDGLVDPACSEKVAAFLGAEVRRHPESNHDMAADAPEWIVETVKRWLEPGSADRENPE